MAIADLQPRQGNVDIVVEVVEKGEIRQFQKFGKSGRVCNAKVKDDSGEIALTLWNDDIDKVNVGDKLHIKNGYVNEWQGEAQLTTGKFGNIEILEKGTEQESEESEADESEEKAPAKKTAKKKKTTKKEPEEEPEESDEDSEEPDEDFDVEEEVIE